MNEDPFKKIIGHIQPPKSSVNIEGTKTPDLAQVGGAIDSSLDSEANQIKINTQDTTIVPKLKEDLKAIVRESIDWYDFIEKILRYKANFKPRNIPDVYVRHILGVIDDVVGADKAGKLIRRYLISKSAPDS